MDRMRHFVHNDAGYTHWLTQNPSGFVINTYAKPSAAYLRLHHATCASISRLQPGARTFTDGDYSKLCGLNSNSTPAASAERRSPARFATECLVPARRHIFSTMAAWTNMAIS